MQFRFAMLDILAKRPDGQAALDEIEREMQVAAECQDEAVAGKRCASAPHLLAMMCGWCAFGD